MSLIEVPGAAGLPVRPTASAHAHAAQLAPEEWALLSSAAIPRTLAPGEVLFRRGEFGQSMFLVEDGEIRLGFDEGMADKVVHKGHFFGELAVFLPEHNRLGRAEASGPARVLELPQSAFEALLAREPIATARFMRRCFAYLVAGEQQLILGMRRRNEDLIQTLDTLRQTRSELTMAQQLVRTDELTGLSNRRGLFAFLEQLGGQPLQGVQLALLLVDIDGFKQVNDRAGHLAGDGALRAVAEEVRGAAGPLELPARLGGDEFALLARVADAGDLANRAIGLVGAVRSLRLPALREHRLTVSVGAVFCRAPGDWSAWYSAADGARYLAKSRGGDGWRIGG